MTTSSPAVPTLDEIRTLVELRYPAPLATVARRCRVAPRADLGGRHKLVIDLFEAYLKFSCIVFLQEARTVCSNVRERLPQKERTLEFLKHPSTGGWVSLLRALCETDFSDRPGVWMRHITAWYRQPRTAENATGLRLLGQIEGLSFDTRNPAPHAETLNALVTYRNKHLAHAATFTEESLQQRLPLLEGTLAYILKSANFLAEMNVFYAERVELLENARFLVHALRLEALAAEPEEIETSTRLEPKEVYLCGSPTPQGTEPHVPLSPFLLWLVNESRKQRETFFFNDAWRTKLEYVSYESGAHYYHHELHSGFQDLITLKLVPGESEDVYAHLSAEARAEGAEQLYKRALIDLENARPEDALECLEASAEYEARAQTFLQMAHIQKALGDPPAAVLQTLERVFEIEPSNPEAHILRGAVVESPAPEPRDAVAETEAEASLPTVLHALCPRPLREYTLLWWAGGYAAWYGLSAILEWLGTGSAASIMPKILQYSCAVGVFSWLTFGRSLMERQRRPLSLQLHSMRLERFELWFDEQLASVFWYLPQKQGRFDWRSALGRYRGEVWGWLASFTVLLVACFLLSNSHAAPAWLWPIRMLDYGFLMFLGYPGLRYILMTTLYVYRVSRLSLKPALSTLNDDGLRSFAPLMVFNILLACVMYALYWLLASLVVTTNVPIDFFFLIVTTAFLAVWGVGMPLMLKRTMRESRSLAVHAYCEHIEKAFRLFLERPGEDELKRYEWLVTHQRVIEKISTWPLSRWQTVLTVVGANATNLAVDVWYIGVRLGWWRHFMPGAGG